MTPYTRRDFTKLALAALPAAGLLSLPAASRAADAASPAKPESAAPKGKVDSKVNGVTIGLNVPYSFGNQAMTGDDILQACVELGLSGVELRAQPVEAFLGVPANLVSARRSAAAGENASKAAPADPNAAKSRAEELRRWRTGVSLNRVGEFRRKYEDAGVLIDILKVDGIFALTDDVLDYYFGMAKALGARAISCEISHEQKDLQRLGSFADKHRLMVGYHGHTATAPHHWEEAFALAKYNGANVDLGHFIAGNNMSVVPFIQKYHERITHIHVKDKKIHEGQNFPFGEGDTPIVEVLRLIRDNKWPIQATIEFEYRVPEGSTRMKEIARAVKYCREALA
jgi:sugar phosphate isomerase/epimerase